jgi:hypothetical protein
LFALAIKIARRHTFGLGHQPSLLYFGQPTKFIISAGENGEVYCIKVKMEVKTIIKSFTGFPQWLGQCLLEWVGVAASLLP